jgi:HSP20 family protein
MLTAYWTPSLPASLNGARRELEHAFHEIHQRQQSGAGRMPLTIWDDDQHVYVQADMPGFLRESIDVRLKDGQLYITGERSVPRSDGDYRHNERMFGSCNRTVGLPETIDPSAVEAEFKDGVLTIAIAKKRDAQPLKIPVKGCTSSDKRITKS